MARNFPRRALAALILLSALAAAAGSSTVGELDEYGIKAALYFKFAKFVAWPAEAFEDDESEFVFGVLGQDPFGERLDRTLQGQTVHGREIVIRRFQRPEEAAECHSLFVSQSAYELLPRVVKVVRERPILLVGDTPRFAHEGGVINLYERGSSVRFEINVDAAKRAELTVDARLLQLARVIRE